MASTHVNRAIGIFPSPFIPCSLNAPQAAVSGGSSTKTLSGENNRLEKKVGNCEAAARDAVGSADDLDSAGAGLTRHTNVLVTGNDLDSDSDELPLIRRLLSPEYNINNNTSKRQRSTSLCELNAHHASTPSLSHNEDGKGSTEDIGDSDFDGTEDDNTLSKRQKLSAPLGSDITLNGRNGQPGRSPSVISGVGEYNDPRSIYGDSNSSCASISTPTTSESSLGDPQLYPKVMDPNEEWEIRKIRGDKYIDGVWYYDVEWQSSLVPEFEMSHALELVAEYEARKAALTTFGHSFENP